MMKPYQYLLTDTNYNIVNDEYPLINVISMRLDLDTHKIQKMGDITKKLIDAKIYDIMPN